MSTEKNQEIYTQKVQERLLENITKAAKLHAVEKWTNIIEGVINAIDEYGLTDITPRLSEALIERKQTNDFLIRIAERTLPDSIFLQEVQTECESILKISDDYKKQQEIHKKG